MSFLIALSYLAHHADEYEMQQTYVSMKDFLTTAI